MLFFFAFLIWRPAITGRTVGGETQTVVVVLKPDASNAITGASVLSDEELSLEELKVLTAEAQREVLEDVNSPSFFERILFVNPEPDVEAERTLEIVPAMVVEATPEGIEELESHPLVEAVYPNIQFELLLAQSVPLINADDVQALQFNGQNIDGRGRSVCVVDTGISPHQDFQDRIVDQKCFCSPNCCPNGQSTDVVATDTHSISHGTHVSGIIGANGQFKGVAPGVDIVAVKVCNLGCGLGDIFAGIDYCLQVKDAFNVVAISGSIGYGGNYQSQQQCPTFFDAAIDAAYNAGVTGVFASGNNGFSNGISYPGCNPNSIAVGATDKNDIIASFTNRGSLLDVLAPGVSITSTKAGNTYGALSGTSQATPHVSGVVALLSQFAQLKGIQLSPDQVRQLLQDTGKPIGNWKRVDALAAVLSLNAPPVVSISSPVDGAVVQSSVTLEGSAVDAEDGSLSSDKLSWASDISGSLGAGNSLQIVLPVGPHTLTLTATDSMGKTASAVVHLTVQQTQNALPVATITVPSDNAVVSSPVNLEGSASDTEDGSIPSEQLSWSSDVSGNLGTGNSLQSSLPSGLHAITLTATDSNGAFGTTLVHITIQQQSSNNPPSIAITSPTGSFVQSPVTFRGSASDVEDGVLTGTWTENDATLGVGNELNVELPQGSHSVTFSATDSAGLISSSSVSFVVQTCQSDLDQNANSLLDIGDFVRLLSSFVADSLPCSSASSYCVVELDMNNNGVVDIGDFVLLLKAYAEEQINDVNGQLCG